MRDFRVVLLLFLLFVLSVFGATICRAADPGFVISPAGFVITKSACTCDFPCDCGAACHCGDKSVLVTRVHEAVRGTADKVGVSYTDCPNGVCLSRPQPAARAKTGTQAVQACSSGTCGQQRRGLFGRWMR